MGLAALVGANMGTKEIVVVDFFKAFGCILGYGRTFWLLLGAT